MSNLVKLYTTLYIWIADYIYIYDLYNLGLNIP